MTLRKITIDNSVRYIKTNSISQGEQTKESKPNVMKNKSLPRKQNEQSQSISKSGEINTKEKNFWWKLLTK